MSYYRAQLEQYETRFREMVLTGEVDKEDERQVHFCTLDSAQGSQADLCIVDLVQTDEPGFTGDLRQQCLTITRSVQAEIIISGPGMFVGMEKLPYQADRGEVLRSLYYAVLPDKGVIAVSTYSICETPNPDHSLVNCPEDDKAVRHIDCRETRKCADNPHNWKECEKVKCRVCGGQHRTSECTEHVTMFQVRRHEAPIQRVQ